MEMEDSSRTRECKRTSEAADASSSSSSSTSSSKRRKVGSSEGAACSGSCTLLTGVVEEVKVAVPSPEASFLGSGEPSRASFSSDLPALSASPSIFDLGEVVEEGFLVGDQLGKSLEMEISACFKGNFREGTPSSELCHDCEKNPLKMELRQFSADNRRTQEVEAEAGRSRMVPPLEEIEEFFSAAEKYEQKRFTEKYNYDVAKDVPLHGRYQWVRLKP